MTNFSHRAFDEAVPLTMDPKLDLNDNLSPVSSPTLMMDYVDRLRVEVEMELLRQQQEKEERGRVAKVIGDRLGRLGDDFEEENVFQQRDESMERQRGYRDDLKDFNVMVEGLLGQVANVLCDRSHGTALGVGIAFALLCYSRQRSPGGG